METSNDIIVYRSISSITCSGNGIITIDGNRNLISCGNNMTYFLGLSNNNEFYPPTQIPNLMNIKMVDCGYYHTVCIDYDGNIFTFGSNEYGQLGNGKDKNELPFTSIPQKITDIPPIDSISCGNNFTICVTDERMAYSFGQNGQGQLGIGNNNELYISPQLIPDLNDIEFIECGGYHVICKTFSNKYYSWGFNFYGQLGQGNNESINKPIKCLNWPEDIIDIKCGSYHTLLLTSAGFVYSLGDNKYGKLGLNDENIKSKNGATLINDIPLIKRIECGYDYSACIDFYNNLWVFGKNSGGQLGLGHKFNRYQPTLNESLHDIIDISLGEIYTIVKTKTNKIYAFGYNGDSQIGIKTNKSFLLTPIQIFKDNGDIWITNTRSSKQKSARK